MLSTSFALVLAFFVAYEHYFVAGQREFLKDDGFRALTALSVALNAKVQKAQKSTDAFIKLVDPKNLPPKNLPPKDREKTLREFLRLYVTDEQISREKWKNIENCSRASIENSGQTPIEIKPGRDSLTLSISCQGRKEGHDLTQSQAPGLYTVDLVKGVNDA